MSKTIFLFGLVLLSLVANGNCVGIECTNIPIENVEPCKDFLSVSANSTKPSEECCNGAKSWIGAPSAVVCLCFKSSPNRLSYKPTEIRAAALPYECKAPEFYKYVSCLLPSNQ
ncbi:hypothetical protein DH2020_007375 [Rehmannia glutinosa]|uniref:Bifunctional inhibitor/plant lipid transfer protein/seed storage helical domain-containing protein n=1 Tax=Rehmannia glutinosa TaxID=99300 RepID=A0ABR0TYU0_REHGL